MSQDSRVNGVGGGVEERRGCPGRRGSTTGKGQPIAHVLKAGVLKKCLLPGTAAFESKRVSILLKEPEARLTVRWGFLRERM